MRIVAAVEAEFRRIIRDARAKDPLISIANLEKHFNRGFSHRYVSKIADKVAREGLIEADRTQHGVLRRLAFRKNTTIAAIVRQLIKEA